MIWNKYTIKTTTDDSDMVCAVLMDYGIFDVQLDNSLELTEEELNAMYADFIKEPPAGGTCFINFYMEFEETEDGRKEQNERLSEIKNGLKEAEDTFNLSPMEFDGEVINSEDWENKWKEYFKPFMVDDIAIKPTWEEIPEGTEAKIVIDIDPGMAFGTGLHETTRLCLRGLRRFMQDGDRVFDLGCGSGILSIGALKLGAGKAVAIDIDPEATRIAEENFACNGISPESFTVYTGNVLEDEKMKEMLEKEPADIVLANILAEIVEPLTKDAHRYLKSGGLYLTSGIIDTKEQVIIDAVKANDNLEFMEVVEDGDWRSIIARRK